MTRLLVLALTILVALPAVSMAQDDVPGDTRCDGPGPSRRQPEASQRGQAVRAAAEGPERTPRGKRIRQSAPGGRGPVRGAGAGAQRSNLRHHRRVRQPDRPCDARHARAASQPDCGARSRCQQHHHLAARLRPRALREDVLLLRARRRHDAELLPHAVLGTLWVHRRGHGVGAGELQ